MFRATTTKYTTLIPEGRMREELPHIVTQDSLPKFDYLDPHVKLSGWNSIVIPGKPVLLRFMSSPMGDNRINMVCTGSVSAVHANTKATFLPQDSQFFLGKDGATYAKVVWDLHAGGSAPSTEASIYRLGDPMRGAWPNACDLLASSGPVTFQEAVNFYAIPHGDSRKFTVTNPTGADLAIGGSTFSKVDRVRVEHGMVRMVQGHDVKESKSFQPANLDMMYIAPSNYYPGMPNPRIQAISWEITDILPDVDTVINVVSRITPSAISIEQAAVILSWQGRAGGASKRGWKSIITPKNVSWEDLTAQQTIAETQWDAPETGKFRLSWDYDSYTTTLSWEGGSQTVPGVPVDYRVAPSIHTDSGVYHLPQIRSWGFEGSINDPETKPLYAAIKNPRMWDDQGQMVDFIYSTPGFTLNTGVNNAPIPSSNISWRVLPPPPMDNPYMSFTFKNYKMWSYKSQILSNNGEIFGDGRGTIVHYGDDINIKGQSFSLPFSQCDGTKDLKIQFSVTNDSKVNLKVFYDGVEKASVLDVLPQSDLYKPWCVLTPFLGDFPATASDLIITDWNGDVVDNSLTLGKTEVVTGTLVREVCIDPENQWEVWSSPWKESPQASPITPHCGRDHVVYTSPGKVFVGDIDGVDQEIPHPEGYSLFAVFASPTIPQTLGVFQDENGDPHWATLVKRYIQPVTWVWEFGDPAWLDTSHGPGDAVPNVFRFNGLTLECDLEK